MLRYIVCLVVLLAVEIESFPITPISNPRIIRKSSPVPNASLPRNRTTVSFSESSRIFKEAQVVKFNWLNIAVY